MDVVIISNYWHFPSEKSSSRYHSIATLAEQEGLSVEVLTSSFYHTKKQQRIKDVILNDDIIYKTTLLEEKSYNKNVCLGRVFSHSQFANNVLKYLKRRKKPDVIYLFVPPIGLAKKVVKYAKRNGIRIIIDILDLWPEAYAMILPSAISMLFLYTMKKSAEYVYANVDDIIAVSETYVKRATKHNLRKNIGHNVFIGTDINSFDRASNDPLDLDNKLRPITIAYIGMLGHSYDLYSVMDAMKLLISQGDDNVELLVMGDGPMKEKFDHYAKQYDLPVRFIGRLDYNSMVKKLVKCDIGINVLVGKSDASIINKHADYVSAGLPIINVQKNQEFGELLKKYEAGLVCMPGDIKGLSEAIDTLAKNNSLRETMGKNSRKLAEEKFNRNKTYQEIIEVIKGE